MAELSPAMQVALASTVVRLFGAVQIDFPEYSLKLIDAPAAFKSAPWDGFLARDPVFGVLGGVDSISDGSGDEAPGISLTLLPSSATAAGNLVAANMQGSRTRCWLGVVDAATGIVVPDPMLVFDGVLDVATLNWGNKKRTVDYDIVSVFERFFDLEEGIRLSDSWLQSVWPGALGLSFVTGVTQTVPWGTNNLGSVVTK
ncbi:hypothetical protein [Sphingomonas sp. Leaf20]|uniref:hypothetical protein n=1 Tax=Sphingomonas sp. Leaf20 TaxID=1735685 RepID=UPI0006FF07D3|nr:hypothetical protein [Sphingomonas sp. Leaf20]KQM73439.1 hypothetical protein ASE72_02045 [Sphingomonas sp. Leaf20]